MAKEINPVTIAILIPNTISLLFLVPILIVTYFQLFHPETADSVIFYLGPNESGILSMNLVFDAITTISVIAFVCAVLGVYGILRVYLQLLLQQDKSMIKFWLYQLLAVGSFIASILTRWMY